MFARDIEAIFTEKVTEFIQKGYIISTSTMSGHQGEIGKVDLRKGNEIIRVLLEQESEYGRGKVYDREKVILTVGRAVLNSRKGEPPFNTMGETIWNNKLEVLEQRTFWQVTRREDFFTEDEAEYEAMMEKQTKRLEERYRKNTKRFTSDAMRKIVLPFVRRQDKCKTTKLSDIKAVEKVERSRFGEGSKHFDYRVELVNGKSFKLA